MAGPIASQSNFGAFVPTTNIWNDIAQIQSVDVKSPEFKQLLVRLYQNINNINLVLNIKDSAYYAEQEFINGQLYFPNPNNSLGSTSAQFRQVFRKVINFGALPNAATTSVAHNIDVLPSFSFTRIYGTATNNTQTSFIPLPFSSPTLNQNIKLEITDTDVVITTAIDYSAYTLTYIVLEFIKQ